MLFGDALNTYQVPQDPKRSLLRVVRAGEELAAISKTKKDFRFCYVSHLINRYIYRCASKVGDLVDNEKAKAINIGFFDHMVINIAEGNLSYLAELYLKLQKPIFILALSILHDYYAAEDVMQETFLKVTTKAKEYRKGTNARAWIFSIARNLCLDSLKRKRLDELTEDIAVTNNFEEKAASTLDIIQMLDVLDETEKQIIVMHFYGGLKKVQIAKLMGVPAGNVRVKYSRALKKLKDSSMISK